MVRWFGSVEFFWLWTSQLISAFGDWVGLFAVTALAANISGRPEAATALVLTARVAPSFFLAPFMGVLVDRYDRKLLMRIADLARALIFCVLPFATQLWQLIVASLLLEVFTLLFAPAKEALVPVLVPRERLTNANSLGILAAYGTMPLAGIAQALLKVANDRLAEFSWLSGLGFGRDIGGTQTLAFYFNAATYVVAYVIVSTKIRTDAHPVRPVAVAGEGAVESDREADAGPADVTALLDTTPLQPTASPERRGLGAVVAEVREGWHLVVADPVVRAVNVGLAAGLLGGAMVVPLGPAFAKEVLGDADSFPLYITALGTGVAVGVALLTFLQDRVPKERVFCGALFFAGISTAFGVCMSTFWMQAIGVFGLGIGAGAVYVLGYTLLQERTEDALRGRTFNTFLTLVRLSVLVAMVLGPAISSLIDPLMSRIVGHDNAAGVPTVQWFGVEYELPGVRITLWLASLVIVIAAVLATRSVGVPLGSRRGRLATPDSAEEDDS